MEEYKDVRKIVDVNGRPHATIALVDGKFGIAVLAPGDEYREQVGINKAVGRAKSRTQANKITIRHQHPVEAIPGALFPLNILLDIAAEEMAKGAVLTLMVSDLLRAEEGDEPYGFSILEMGCGC